jgi:Bacterial extracellular solute-binding protein, family 7
MLAGLDAVGITGLALLPEGLRHVFSFGDPLLTPGDFEGITVRAPTSDTTYALFEALGATPDDLGGPGDRFGVGVADGSVAAAESSFAFAGGLPAAATAAGNVTLYPKVNVVVANSAALDGLDETEQEVLRDAAIATRDWAITNNRDDADYAPEFCANGGTIVLASDEEVAGLVEATGPVYSELEADAATAAMITRIRALAEEVGPGEPITACTYESPVTLPPDPAETTGESSPDAAEFPEGTYRMEITAEFLIDAGVDQASAFNHHGTWTLTFDDGTLIGSDVNASTGKVSEGRGVYCVEDGRVSLGLLGQPPECGDFWSAGWTLEGDQLQFTDVQSHHGSDLLIETLFGGQPFTRIE